MADERKPQVLATIIIVVILMLLVGVSLGSRESTMAVFPTVALGIVAFKRVMDDQKNQAASRRRRHHQDDPLWEWAEEKVKQRQEFRQHLAVYIVVNTILWVIWLITGAGFPWPIFPTMGWGIGIVAHYVEYQQKYGRGYNADKRAIETEVQREIERERRRQQKIQDIVDRERRNSDDDPIRFE